MDGLGRLQNIVSYRLGNISKELAALSDVFKSYVQMQEQKVNQRPALKHGLDFYFDQLKLADK
jgi:hypothetical protein